MAKEIKNRALRLQEALARFEEVLNVFKAEPENVLFRDASIQRFEFTIELYWKVLKNALEVEGFLPQTPRDAFAKAYQVDLINDESVWLSMLKDRNLTSHIYQEEVADQVAQNLFAYCAVMKKSFSVIKNKLALV